jgi:hypothetical protein
MRANPNTKNVFPTNCFSSVTRFRFLINWGDKSPPAFDTWLLFEKIASGFLINCFSNKLPPALAGGKPMCKKLALAKFYILAKARSRPTFRLPPVKAEGN